MGSQAVGNRSIVLLSILFASVLVFAAAPADAAKAKPKAPHAAAAKEAPPAVPLSDIRVLGDRPAPFALDAKAAMMVDAQTGAVLYAYNEHQRMQPASLAKIMTFYLTLDALDQKRITLDTTMPISEKAWRLSMDESVSRMFLGVGQQVAVHDLLYGLMVSSGNDAAVTLAEYLGGSENGFTQQMNAKAKEVGLTETHFSNPDGLPVEDEYTTAADMVKLGCALLKNHPEALTYTDAKEFTFDKITQRNFNTLLFYDSRVNGIKTGHVDEAGYHLVSSATSKGTHLVSAVMGTPSSEKRRVETEKLVDWAFRTFVTAKPDSSKVVPATLPVFYGMVDSVTIAPTHATYVTVGKGEESKIAVTWTPSAKYLSAPVTKGAEVGQIAITADGKPIDSVPVVTQAGVAQAGFFKRLRDRFRHKP
ncbi:MAG TPA: D-alanyl-D-alanine carboxypeptidase family protein [Candidatus Binataceae bacterium]|nr:D-alanyl-D-alanine carboxypeptidase family protein [Candidatus Binataceae bacterium]